MPELKYRFTNLSIHDAITVQMAIEARLTGMTNDLKGSDRAIKAVVEELELMYDDLNRHIAAIEREQFYYEKAKKEQGLSGMSKDLLDMNQQHNKKDPDTGVTY